MTAKPKSHNQPNPISNASTTAPPAQAFVKSSLDAVHKAKVNEDLEVRESARVAKRLDESRRRLGDINVQRHEYQRNPTRFARALLTSLSHLSLVARRSQSKANAALSEWRGTLTKGSVVMAADGTTTEGGMPFLGKWFTAKVAAMADIGAPVKDYTGSYTFERAALKLTFNGFSARYDRWYPVDTREVQPASGFGGARAAVMRGRKRKKAEAVAAAWEANMLEVRSGEERKTRVRCFTYYSATVSNVINTPSFRLASLIAVAFTS